MVPQRVPTVMAWSLLLSTSREILTLKFSWWSKPRGRAGAGCLAGLEPDKELPPLLPGQAHSPSVVYLGVTAGSV